jgi:hypothetical protein
MIFDPHVLYAIVCILGAVVVTLLALVPME